MDLIRYNILGRIFSIGSSFGRIEMYIKVRSTGRQIKEDVLSHKYFGRHRVLLIVSFFIVCVFRYRFKFKRQLTACQSNNIKSALVFLSSLR